MRSLLPFIFCTVIAAKRRSPTTFSLPPSSTPAVRANPAKSAVAGTIAAQADARASTLAASRGGRARGVAKQTYRKLCAGVKPGGGRILVLPQAAQGSSVGRCKQAVAKATKGSK